LNISVGFGSRSLFRYVVQERLFLFVGEKLEETHGRLQEDTRVAGLRSCQQPLAALALGEQLNSIKDFCLGDLRRKEFCCRLFRNPCHNPSRGLGPHEL
jgi:hypothetical protein